MSQAEEHFDPDDDHWDYGDYDDDEHGLDCDCEDCTYEYHASECGQLPDQSRSTETIVATCDQRGSNLLRLMGLAVFRSFWSIGVLRRK